MLLADFDEQVYVAESFLGTEKTWHLHYRLL